MSKKSAVALIRRHAFLGLALACTAYAISQAAAARQTPLCGCDDSSAAVELVRRSRHPVQKIDPIRACLRCELCEPSASSMRTRAPKSQRSHTTTQARWQHERGAKEVTRKTHRGGANREERRAWYERRALEARRSAARALAKLCVVWSSVCARTESVRTTNISTQNKWAKGGLLDCFVHERALLLRASLARA